MSPPSKLTRSRYSAIVTCRPCAGDAADTARPRSRRATSRSGRTCEAGCGMLRSSMQTAWITTRFSNRRHSSYGTRMTWATAARLDVQTVDRRRIGLLDRDKSRSARATADIAIRPTGRGADRARIQAGPRLGIGIGVRIDVVADVDVHIDVAARIGRRDWWADRSAGIHRRLGRRIDGRMNRRMRRRIGRRRGWLTAAPCTGPLLCRLWR